MEFKKGSLYQARTGEVLEFEGTDGGEFSFLVYDPRTLKPGDRHLTGAHAHLEGFAEDAGIVEVDRATVKPIGIFANGLEPDSPEWEAMIGSLVNEVSMMLMEKSRVARDEIAFAQCVAAGILQNTMVSVVAQEHGASTPEGEKSLTEFYVAFGADAVLRWRGLAKEKFVFRKDMKRDDLN